MHLIFWSALVWASMTAGPVTAQAPANAKFRVDGQTLIYDTENIEDTFSREMEDDDVDALIGLLRANPAITTLQLNSGGGSVYAGDEMARVAIDFDLDTVVAGECISSCVNLFLAGNRRTMLLGSKIGFHRRYWSPESVESYYEKWRETERWETPFDFASWVYQDTQAEIYEDLTYLLDRGVKAEFAIRSKQVGYSEEWFPSRLALTAGGVLRERVAR